MIDEQVCTRRTYDSFDNHGDLSKQTKKCCTVWVKQHTAKLDLPSGGREWVWSSPEDCGYFIISFSYPEGTEETLELLLDRDSILGSTL